MSVLPGCRSGYSWRGHVRLSLCTLEDSPMAVIENRGGLADPPVIFGWLFDFAVGSAFLRTDHREWLKSVAVPFFDRHPEGTYVLMGSASRSGSASFNR